MRQIIPTNEIYLERVNKVIEYIDNNLDSQLDIKTLAEISNFSMFHFHKIMRAFLKEPLYEYINRIRLESAARFLRYSQLPIQEIAENIGYDAPSSLSKAFKQRFGISPSEYRENKGFTIQREFFVNENLKLKSPKIKEKNDRTIIYIRLLGEYSKSDYGTAYKKLWEYVKVNKLFGAGMETLGISYNDPKITDESKCRYEACVTIRKDVAPSSDIGVKELRGGLFAVFMYQGPYNKLSVAYDNIFAQWLPYSGYELRDNPVLERYLNNPDKTLAEKLKTEIYVPVKKL